MGKHFHELLGFAGPMTHRQFEAWQSWLAEQWNVPDRGDWYLMALRATLLAVHSKEGTSVSIGDMKLPPFVTGPVTPADEEEQLRMNTAVILGVAGIGAEARQHNG